MVSDRVKRVERGCARAAEQVFRSRELMPSCPVAESESMVEIIFSPFLGAKVRVQEKLGMPGKDGDSEGLGTQDL